MKRLLGLVTFPRLMIFALLFLWSGCIAGHAQAIVMPTVKMVINAPSLPTGGMKHRWRASDLASSPVSTWTDSISGNSLTAAGSARPTWSTNGVLFDGVANIMDFATNIVNTTNVNFLLVAKWNALPTAGQTAKILGDKTSNSIMFVGVNNVAGATYFHNKASITAIPFANTATLDFLAAGTTLATPFQVFTNGTSAWTHATDTWNSGMIINAMSGQVAGLPQWFSGVVKEYVVWTNAVFTASDIAQIHAYAVATYGVSP